MADAASRIWQELVVAAVRWEAEARRRDVEARKIAEYWRYELARYEEIWPQGKKCFGHPDIVRSASGNCQALVELIILCSFFPN